MNKFQKTLFEFTSCMRNLVKSALLTAQQSDAGRERLAQKVQFKPRVAEAEAEVHILRIV